MSDSMVYRKLGIKPAHRVLVLNAPPGYERLFSASGEPVATTVHAGDRFDFILVFVRSQADVKIYTERSLRATGADSPLWFAYPKKASAVKTDMSRDAGWEPLAAAGLRPVSLVAIDDTWSALRFRAAEKVHQAKKQH